MSAASPDGGTDFNKWLSGKRGKAAQSLLQARYQDISSEIFYIDPVGEDWGTFRKVAMEDPDIPDREKLLELIDSNASPEEKERRLRQMKPTFRYILKHHIYLMRSSAVTFNISVPAIALGYLPGLPAPELGIATGDIMRRTVPQAVPAPPVDRKMIFAARTNLLVPAPECGGGGPDRLQLVRGCRLLFPVVACEE